MIGMTQPWLRSTCSWVVLAAGKWVHRNWEANSNWRMSSHEKWGYYALKEMVLKAVHLIRMSLCEKLRALFISVGWWSCFQNPVFSCWCWLYNDDCFVFLRIVTSCLKTMSGRDSFAGFSFCANTFIFSELSVRLSTCVIVRCAHITDWSKNCLLRFRGMHWQYLLLSFLEFRSMTNIILDKNLFLDLKIAFSIKLFPLYWKTLFVESGIISTCT